MLEALARSTKALIEGQENQSRDISELKEEMGGLISKIEGHQAC